MCERKTEIERSQVHTFFFFVISYIAIIELHIIIVYMFSFCRVLFNNLFQFKVDLIMVYLYVLFKIFGTIV